jgi:transcription initiation factor TFIID subunit 7
MSDNDDFVPGKEEEDDFAAPALSASLRRGRGAEPKASTSKAKSKGRNNAPSGPVPKLKVKMAAPNAGIQEPMYTTRKHDRELDSDPEEDLIVEEQFILRLPQGEMLKKIREQVASRELGKKKGGDEPWFKFRDSRRAVFGYGKPNKPDQSQLYHAKLVDLPCIIESHKTPDAGKHMYKVCDINQMLLVEEAIPPGQDPEFFDNDFNIEDYIYPHGITPPLRHVRKRRFRKRANKRVCTVLHSLACLNAAPDDRDGGTESGGVVENGQPSGESDLRYASSLSQIVDT